jgi:hypothetical protein
MELQQDALYLTEDQKDNCWEHQDREHDESDAEYRGRKASEKAEYHERNVGKKLHRILKEKLKDEGTPVLNASHLDWLLANQQFIPEQWKGKIVFFWGTIYRDRTGDECVRQLCWLDDKWFPSYRSLRFGWNDNDYAAILISE